MDKVIPKAISATGFANTGDVAMTSIFFLKQYS